jgi:AmiR/NasT family two-component response regulator
VTTDETAVALERLLAVTEASLERRAQLQYALESRIAIEQAKGIIAERYGLGVEDAFDLIRRASRSNRIKIQEMVARIQPGEPTPAEISALLDV